MKKPYIITAILAASASSSISAVEFSANLGVGQDSNPHHLSDQFSPDSELFAKARFKSHSNIAELFYWGVDVDKTLYPDDKRAESFNVEADLKFQHDFDLWETNYQYFVGLDYQHFDKTFVSKQTGAVATINGVSLADRYDHDDKGYYLGIGFSSSETFDYRFSYIVDERDYVDFSVPNIDRLDYEDNTFQFDLNLNTLNDGFFYLNLGYRNRFFIERNDRDFEGNVIVDSALEYNDVIANLGYVYQPDENTRWEYVFNFVNRYSNGTDYYESERARIEINADYRLADYHIITSQLAYQTYFFDDDFDQPYEFMEEDQIEKRGFKFKIEYTWVLATLFKTNLGLFANLEARIYDSPDDIFDYEQHQINMGIRWAMD